MIREDQDGVIWISEASALFRYDPQTNRLSLAWKVPFRRGVKDRLLHLTIDRDQSFWLSDLSPEPALFKLDKDLKNLQVFTYDPRNPSSIASGQPGDVAEDRNGDLWVLTTGAINRMNRRSGTVTRFTPEWWTEKRQGTHIHLDRSGVVWVSTLEGLYRFNDSSGYFTRFVPTDPRVLPMIGKIQEDSEGYFWFFAGHWMSRFDPRTGRFLHFDRSDGLDDIEILHWSHTRLQSGELVFGTMDGILVFQPGSVRPSSFVPPTVITGIRKANRNVDLGGSRDSVHSVTMGSRDNVFSISYAALSFDSPEDNQYAYMLEGFDDAWTYCGNDREVTYTNLDPGEYVFHVKGSNHSGVWNETGTDLRIVVEPAWWQTWWLRTIAAGLVIGGLSLLYRRKVRRLQREREMQRNLSRQLIEWQEVQRHRLAAELHDGLGQDLLVASNELQQYLRDRRRPAEELARAAEMVRGSIQTVREISGNLHPHQLDRIGFCATVESMVDKVAHASGLAIHWRCDLPQGALPKETEIHVFRIIQEALTNVVRHSQATNVSLNVTSVGGDLRVAVVDDGKGFAPPFGSSEEGGGSSQSGTGLGLASMRERAGIIGGSLRIISSPGSGTSVILTIPHR